MSFDPEPTNELLLEFLDDGGKHATMRYNVSNEETDPSTGTAGDIAAAAAQLSKSAMINQSILIRAFNTAPGTPTAGPYARPADKLDLTLQGADGTRPHIQIGGPNESDFTNGIDWDPTDTHVAALIAALKTNAKTASGADITGVINGFRRRPPRRKGQ